jgi:hypothetical protein
MSIRSGHTRLLPFDSPNDSRQWSGGIDLEPQDGEPLPEEVTVRTTIAAIGAALLATLGLAAWQARTTAEARSPLAVGGHWNPAAGQVLPAGGALAAVPDAPAVVRCAPGQQAVIAQSLLDGRVVTRAECVWAADSQATFATPVGYAAAPGYGRPVPAADIVEYSPQPRTVRYAEPVRRVPAKPKRSWQKSALVIGGAAGAGAGIGALTGGKKGALIGAAIGGGAGSIFEAVKRN